MRQQCLLIFAIASLGAARALTPLSAGAATPPPFADEAPVTLDEAGEAADEKVLPRERQGADAGDAVPLPAPIESEQPLPRKVRPPDEPPPEVTIRAAGDYVVEEYRRHGRVWMVRYVPKDGVPYTFIDSDGDGRLEGDPREGRIQPVYFTVYEWE